MKYLRDCHTNCLLYLQRRSFSAVLFRRIATKTRKDPITNETKELFSTLAREQRLVIRQKLVTCLTNEPANDVRRKIGDAVAEIARQYTDNGMHNAGMIGDNRSDAWSFSS